MSDPPDAGSYAKTSQFQLSAKNLTLTIMELYGSYETIKEISSGPVATVYTARKSRESAAPNREVIVKVFSPANLSGGSTRVWRRSEFGINQSPTRSYSTPESFLRGVKRQHDAQARGSRHIVPVYETGQDSRGAWYATQYYARSLKKIIDGRVSLSPADFYHVICSIVRGALDLKNFSGQSHGNLKPTNVFIGEGKLGRADVVLADPLRDDPASVGNYDLSDLRGIGEMIYQLVRRKEISAAANWPLPSSPEWSSFLGEDADRWRDLCNRLIDPDLSLEKITLEKLEAELLALKPKPPVSTPMLITLGAALVLVGLGSYFLIAYLIGGKYGSITITTNPSGAEVWFNSENTQKRTPYQNKKLPPGELNYRLKLDSYDDWSGVTNVAVRKNMQLHIPLIRQTGTVILRSDPPGAETFTNGVAVGTTPLTNRFLTGTHVLAVRYPGLKEQKVVMPVENQQTKLHLVEFPRGTVRVTSDPSGATVLLGNRPMGKTPADLLVDPGSVNFELQLDGYNNAIIRTNIANKGNVTVSVILLEGQGAVEVRSDPPGAEIFWQNQLQQQRTPTILKLPRGAQELIFRYQSLREQKRMVDVGMSPPKPLDVLFPHGKLIVNTTPPGAQIFNAADLVGITPTNLLVDPGPVNLEFKLNNFSGSLKTNLVADQTLNVTVLLTAGRGKVYVVTNPRGANIFSLNGNLIGKAESSLDLPSGLQTLIARHPQHTNLVEQQFSVLVETGPIKTNLISFRYGGLIVTSEPAGATLLQNSSEIGLTPYTNGFLPPGPVIYELRFENYQKEGLTAEIVAGQTNRLHKQLIFGTGIAAFTSDPPGAQIFTNGNLAGPAPLTNILRAGTNLVTARFRNWPAQSTNLLVRLGETKPAVFYFPHGLLKIESDPPGATISLGSELVGTTPTNLITPTGRLSYDLTLPGFSPTNLSVSVTDHLSTNLSVKLFKPESQIETMTNSIGMIFLKVPKGYWVGQSEVTLDEYDQLMGEQRRKPPGNQQPIQKNWVDAIEFCGKLTEEDVKKNLFNANAYLYSLPKPSEWREIAAVPGLAGVLRFGPKELNRTAGIIEWCYTFENQLYKPAPVVSLSLGGNNSIALGEPKPLDKYTSTLTFRCVLVPREARFLK